MNKLLATAFVLVISITAFTRAATYGGGSGTNEDPYQIGSVDDFMELSATPDDWDKHFILMTDIDLASQTFRWAPIAPDTSSSTEWFQGTQFIGVFDGNGHTISNLTITNSSYAGLFGFVGSGGQILNLGVENVKIGGGRYVGGLAGYNYYGTITDCYATGSVGGGEAAGGLVGGNNCGTVTGCHATGSVSGGYGIGGLVAVNTDGMINICYATNMVYASGWAGGLVGRYLGGTVTNCYATGSVDGESLYGSDRLVGRDGFGKITNCYTTSSLGGESLAGGLMWNNLGTITSIDFETMTLSTFIDAGWDFVNVWYMMPGNYPQLNFPSEPSTLVIKTNPSFITSTSPTVGQHKVYQYVAVNAKEYIQCPDVYTFDHWEGEGILDPNSPLTTVTMDQNKTITAVFVDARKCGDECHPYPPMDFNQNCLVELADFAMFAVHWMECTAPECD
ncbi:MAG: hypothetical protein JW860_00415 [Sedimentisphaerales bacterium]|nr:hypothetical protein [Sedimentisphaerales bacterium]